MGVMLRQPWLRQVRSVHSSEERKAVEAGDIIAASLGLTLRRWPTLRENDRSATGYLEPVAFDGVVEKFFAEPDRSACGWETAVCAQARIIDSVERVLATAPDGDVAIVAHGGVGTLLLCHLKGIPTDRRQDQPAQGHFFVFRRHERQIISGWRPIDG